MNPEIAAKIHAHLSKFPRRTYPKGQILVFADESPEHIFYLVSGRVRKYDVSYKGDEVIVNIFQPPAFFPMSWAINRTENHFFYKTETNTELHVVPTAAALEFIKSNPDVMLDLLSRIYKGMDSLLGRVVHLMSGTAKSRLIYDLIIECRRSNTKTQRGSYTLMVTELDLAARTGLSRETVSREMRKLKENNTVTIENKQIMVNDISALESMLGSEI